MTYRVTCDICLSAQDVESYSDFACENCGQEHAYDEGRHIVLSSGQLEMLREEMEARKAIDQINPTAEEWLELAKRSGAPEYMRYEP